MAGRFDNGVLYYTKGYIDVNFPENEVKCKYCRFFRCIEDSKQFRCNYNNAVLYSKEHIGVDCPIRFEGEIKEEE